MSEKWICKIHDQKEYCCIKDGEYEYHIKNYNWDGLRRNTDIETDGKVSKGEDKETNTKEISKKD